MKKNILLIIVLATSLPWMGCNKAGKLNQASTAPTPSGPVELKLKWPVGQRVVQDMEMKQNMEMNIPGQPAPIKQSLTMGQEYGITVLKDTPDGGHEVEMEYLTARMNMGMGGKMMDYDSTKKSSGGSTNPIADIFGKIIGAKILFFLNGSNEVERVEGVDDFLSRLSTGNGSAAVAPFKSMFNEGYFKQMMSANKFMPPKAVQPGDTWPVQIEYPMGQMGTMVMNYTFTFQSWEMHGKRNCARMEFDGTITSKADATAASPAMSISILDGTSSGTSWFDPEMGITIDTTMNQDMKMVVKIPKNPRAPKTAAAAMQSITNQMNQVINIKLVSVK